MANEKSEQPGSEPEAQPVLPPGADPQDPAPPPSPPSPPSAANTPWPGAAGNLAQIASAFIALGAVITSVVSCNTARWSAKSAEANLAVVEARWSQEADEKQLDAGFSLIIEHQKDGADGKGKLVVLNDSTLGCDRAVIASMTSLFSPRYSTLIAATRGVFAPLASRARLASSESWSVELDGTLFFAPTSSVIERMFGNSSPEMLRAHHAWVAERFDADGGAASICSLAGECFAFVSVRVTCHHPSTKRPSQFVEHFLVDRLGRTYPLREMLFRTNDGGFMWARPSSFSTLTESEIRRAMGLILVELQTPTSAVEARFGHPFDTAELEAATMGAVTKEESKR